jgi:GMP synthase-like glutamine amidotransferase
MILVVDMNQKKNSLGFYEFVLPLVAVVKALGACTVKHYGDIRQEAIAQCDAVILSGTPLKDNATLNQLGKFEWIKTFDKPILGVCAGFQTLGLVFGARLKRCLGIGMTEINTVRENCLFSDEFQAYTLHNYSVGPAEEFEVLAESGQCIQAIKLKQRNVYGVLFHPEVRNPEILQRFVSAFSGHRRV